MRTPWPHLAHGWLSANTPQRDSPGHAVGLMHGIAVRHLTNIVTQNPLFLRRALTGYPGIIQSLPTALSPSNTQPDASRQGNARGTPRVHHGVAEKTKTAPAKSHHQVTGNNRNGPAATTGGGHRGWRAQQTEGGHGTEGGHISAAGSNHHQSNQPVRHGSEATDAP